MLFGLRQCNYGGREPRKAVIPINRLVVSLIGKTRLRIYWYRDVTWRPARTLITPSPLRLRVRCCPSVELSGIKTISEDLLLCAGMSWFFCFVR